MAFDWKTGPLAEGLRCYSTRRFFEAHEHWEAVWLTLQEPEKSFLQALIQITAAFHHLQRGNRDGAISLLRRSLRRLESAPAEFCSLQVEALRDQLAEMDDDAKRVGAPIKRIEHAAPTTEEKCVGAPERQRAAERRLEPHALLVHPRQQIA